MTKLRNALLLLAVAAPVLSAQTTTPKNEGSIPTGDADNGIHAMTMLMRGVTPRGVALGEAMGAVEGDPSTFFYNTAGIARGDGAFILRRRRLRAEDRRRDGEEQ